MEFFKTDTAIVKDAQIGKRTKIWEYSNIYGCQIGEDCNIGAYVEIQSDVVIGCKVTVSSHSFICSLVTVEDDVFIGHGVMTVNDLKPPSLKREGTRKNWKKTLIKKGSVIGSNVTLFPVIIGENSIVGAGAVVTKNVEPYTIVGGNPAVEIRKRFSESKIEELLALEWWNWSVEKISKNLPFLTANP